LILADEARIQSCGGLELTDEIRVTYRRSGVLPSTVTEEMIRIAVFVVPTGTFKHAV
jgi:hypothetical protein